MVVKRGSDGNIVDDSTEDGTVDLTDRGSTLGRPQPKDATVASGGRSLGADYDTPTVQASGSGLTSIPAARTGAPASGGRSLPSDEDATRIVGRLGEDAPTENTGGAGTPAQPTQRTSAADDPPVGWLVVISGPGRGETLHLGHGRNPIGRGEDMRVRADFGDEEISRSAHAAVTYDPKSRRFFLNHGEGTNLTYLGDDPVLQPVEISGNEHITLGATTFRFVAFCGTDFDWT